jgi:hypothetical protein
VTRDNSEIPFINSVLRIQSRNHPVEIPRIQRQDAAPNLAYDADVERQNVEIGTSSEFVEHVVQAAAYTRKTVVNRNIFLSDVPADPLSVGRTSAGAASPVSKIAATRVRDVLQGYMGGVARAIASTIAARDRTRLTVPVESKLDRVTIASACKSIGPTSAHVAEMERTEQATASAPTIWPNSVLFPASADHLPTLAGDEIAIQQDSAQANALRYRGPDLRMPLRITEHTSAADGPSDISPVIREEPPSRLQPDGISSTAQVHSIADSGMNTGEPPVSPEPLAPETQGTGCDHPVDTTFVHTGAATENVGGGQATVAPDLMAPDHTAGTMPIQDGSLASEAGADNTLPGTPPIFVVPMEATTPATASAPPVVLQPEPQPVKDSMTEAATGPRISDAMKNISTYNTNGTTAIMGSGVPGSTVQLAVVTATGPQVVGYADVSADGMWSIDALATAVGFGNQSLLVRSVDTSGAMGSWSGPYSSTLADPLAGAIHAGESLRDRLLADAASGRDATADLQELADLANGKDLTTLDIPPGVYTISQTLLLNSNTILNAPGVTLLAARDWTTAPAGSVENSLLAWTMVANDRFSATANGDTNIHVSGLTVDWNGHNSNGSAAIRFVGASNVSVTDTTLIGSEDGTAFVGCDGALVDNCVAIGTTNYGFDNWNGPKNTIIRNSTVYVARFGGIAITAQPTDATKGNVALNNIVTGNTIYGADRFGIDINSLNSLSFEKHILVSDNRVYGTGLGIQVLGPSSDVMVVGNALSGSIGSPELRVSNQTLSPGTLDANDIVVNGNAIANAFMGPNAMAAIVVQAYNANVIGNTVDFGVIPSGIWAAGSEMILKNNYVNASQKSISYSTLWGSNLNVLVSDLQLSDPPKVEIVSKSGTYHLTGVGTADLTKAKDCSTIYSINGAGQTIYLPRSGPAVLHVTGGASNGYEIGFGRPGAADVVTVIGSGNGDAINLGGADACVLLGGSNETVVGGDGNDTFYVDSISARAAIDGGGGVNQIVLVGERNGDNHIVLGDNIRNIADIKMTMMFPSASLTLNRMEFISAYASDEGVTITAGGAHQTLYGGLGKDTLVGFDGGETVFAGRACDLRQDTIWNFIEGDTINITDLIPNGRVLLAAVPSAISDSTILRVGNGSVNCSVELRGNFSDVSKWFIDSDNKNGSILSYLS